MMMIRYSDDGCFYEGLAWFYYYFLGGAVPIGMAIGIGLSLLSLGPIF